MQTAFTNKPRPRNGPITREVAAMKNNNLKIQAQVKRETEKALLLTVNCDFHQGLKGLDLWFPKSQVTVIDDGLVNIAEWIVNRKKEEVKESYRGFICFIEEV